MKKCSKCGVEKALDEFHKESRSKDGLRANCKTCQKAYLRQRYYDNRDTYSKLSKEHYARNRSTIAARSRDYYARNADERRAQKLEYQKTPQGRRSLERARHRRRANKAAAVPQRWVRSECPDTLCYWCGVDLATTETHVEHLMPIALGGPAVPSNEAKACKDCNLSKSDTHPLVWLARMF